MIRFLWCISTPRLNFYGVNSTLCWRSYGVSLGVYGANTPIFGVIRSPEWYNWWCVDCLNCSMFKHGRNCIHLSLLLSLPCCVSLSACLAYLFLSLFLFEMSLSGFCKVLPHCNCDFFFFLMGCEKILLLPLFHWYVHNHNNELNDCSHL